MTIPTPPTTDTIDQNYFKSATESNDQYNTRIAKYNAEKPQQPTSNTGSVANQGKPGYDVFGNPVANSGIDIARQGQGTHTGIDGTTQYYNYDNSPVTPTATGTQNGTTNTDPNAPQLADQTDRQALAQAQQDYQATAKQVHDTILNIQNGVTPLTPGEQAQIAGLQQQFQTLIDAQQLTNTGANGLAQTRGYQSGAAEYDPTFQVKTIGAIIQAGAAKVTDLQVKEASAVAQLTQAFHNDDIAAVKSAWSIFQDASKSRQDALQKTIDDTQKAIKDAADAKIAADKVQYDTVTKPINDVAQEYLKNTGDKAGAAKITAAQTVGEALALAGPGLQTGTGDVGDYLQYKNQANLAGHVPMDFDAWKKAKDAQDVKQASAKAYATAYATESAKSQFVSSPANQQKLEQQYRTVLLKELSNRSGGLGLQDAKVNQAIHLKSLYDQYYDPKTGGYNIPTAQYAELALGLANLISPTGNTAESDRQNILSKTGAGRLNEAIQYVTGVPQNGNTQSVIKNLIDSINRQGAVAEDLRNTYVDNLHGFAPTDLSPDRVQALEKNTLPSFLNPKGDPLIAEGAQAKKTVDTYIKSNPSQAESIAKMYGVPGITDADIVDYLQQNGKI